MEDIRRLSKAELEQAMLEIGESKFHGRQIHEWLWKKGVHSIDDMTNLSKKLRTHLNEHFRIHPTNPSIIQESVDGTIKIGFKCHDERMVEGVMIPADDRYTACISSQVGCSLSCSFCATGQLARERNLEAGEIYDQVKSLNDLTIEKHGRPLTNIVYMGMGEPLANYDHVMQSIEHITSPEGLGMSPRRITLSTVGIASRIKQLADDEVRFKLAWSIHAPTDEKRSKIMDVNKSNPIRKVMDALAHFADKTGNKITFEYVLLRNFNDSYDDARELASLANELSAFVNIIEYNAVEGTGFGKSKSNARNAFVAELERREVTVKVRRSRGEDIDAACGQLANRS